MSKAFLSLVAVVAALVLSASAAQAAIISFENPPGPGHFVWPMTDDFRFLDLAQPASASPTAPDSSHASGQVYFSADSASLLSGNANHLVRGPDADGFLLSLSAGTVIDASGVWQNDGIILWPDLGPTEIPENVETFVATRFNPTGAIGTNCSTSNPLNPCHYGWIKVVRTGFELDALAWAYEDQPGVPIAAGAVPEPASLSLLLIGGGALLRHRRSRA